MTTKLVIAIATQATVFTIFAYIDTWATVHPDPLKVQRFALNPLVILLYGLSITILWRTYRTIYTSLSKDFWTAKLLTGFVIASVSIGAAYLASKRTPTTTQLLALGLSLLATLLSNIKTQ